MKRLLQTGIVLAIAWMFTACGTVPTPNQPAITPQLLSTFTPVPPTLTPRPEAPRSQAPKPGSTPDASLAAIQMMNENDGWAVSADGRVLRTTGGIEAWEDVTPADATSPQSDPPRFLPVHFFLDDQHAWVAMWKSSSSTATLYYTEDGGESWKISGALPVSQPVELYGPVSFYFIDAQNGWLWTQIYTGMHHVYPALFQTRNGGKNWKMVFDPGFQASVPDDSLQASYSLSYGLRVFTFTDSQNGFAGAGKLYRTSNSGKKWSAVDLSAPSGMPSFTQPYTYVTPPVFADTDQGVVFVTVYEFDRVMLPPGDQFEGLPKASYLSWTRNGGQRWQSAQAPTLLGTVSLLDGQTGWFLGKSDANPGAPVSLFQTLDGGNTWNVVDENCPLPLGSQIQFINTTLGFATPPERGAIDFFARYDARLGRMKGYLYWTQDGGMTWEVIKPVIR